MNIISNERLIKRNQRIAQITGLAGLAVLFIGMYVLFRSPEQFTIIWGTIIAGFILSQVGIYFTNRYGRSPRPDQKLDAALKGLNDTYTIYHYRTPTAHLLIGPAGVWVMMPRYQRGTITYSKGRFRQKGGGIMLNYLKIFGQEGIGRPELEAESEKEAIIKYFKKLMPDQEPPPVDAVLLFTDERAVLENVEEAPVATMDVKKIKEFRRKTAKSHPFSMEKVKQIREAIGEE